MAKKTTSGQSLADRQQAQAIESDAQALREMAKLALDAKTQDFARRALAGLLAMGVDPAADLLDSRFSHMFSRDKISLVEDASALGPVGAPLLREMLKGGASPEGAQSAGAMTPLMVAACQGHVDAMEALSEFGADWGARVDPKRSPTYFTQRGLSPIAVLMIDGPRRQGWQEEDGSAMARWRALCESAIASVKNSPSALSEALVAATLSYAEPLGAQKGQKPASLALFEGLKAAGADPAFKPPAMGALHMALKRGGFSPIELAVSEAGMGRAERAMMMMEVFGEGWAQERLAAAFGAGMMRRLDSGDAKQPSSGAQLPWLEKSEMERLASVLAPFNPARAMARAWGEKASLGSALGALCQPQWASSFAHKEGVAFAALWIKKARAGGHEFDAAHLARELGRGAAQRLFSDSEDEEASERQKPVWPTADHMRATAQRLSALAGLDPALAEQLDMMLGSLALHWAKSAETLAQWGKPSAARSEGGAHKKAASFLAGASDALAGIKAGGPIPSEQIKAASLALIQACERVIADKPNPDCVALIESALMSAQMAASGSGGVSASAPARKAVRL